MLTQREAAEILTRFGKEIELLFGSHLRSVRLFGSYARNEAEEGSDMDVLILVDLPREEIVRYRQAVTDIAGEYLLSKGVLIAPILENESFFQRHIDISPFFRNVEREGVLIGA